MIREESTGRKGEKYGGIELKELKEKEVEKRRELREK